MSSLLEIDSIIKSFDNKVILSDISLQCRTGEIVGIFGKNGTGKSTLLKIIFGTLSAENKFIRLNGKVATQPYKLKNGLSYLPQFQYLPNNLTVNSVLTLCLDYQQYDMIKKDLIIAPVLKTKIKSLSFGIVRYLQTLLILKNNSHFCLMDEPFSGLSPVMCEKVIEEIKSQLPNKGIIITDHKYQDVLSICTKIYILKNQSLIKLEQPEDLIIHNYINQID
jgi:lipopolysaccharide export system ATP-binding protein